MLHLLTKCNQTLIPKSHHHLLQSVYNVCPIVNFTSSISLVKQQKTSTATELVSVVDYFKSFGFSDTQIKTIISKNPLVLSSDVSKTIRPKIEFYQSIGLSQQDVINIVTYDPYLLKRSLKNHLIPAFDLLKHYYGGQEIAVNRVKKWPSIFRYGNLNWLPANVKVLRDFGVPESRIMKMITRTCCGVYVKTTPDHFRKVVTAVIDMGFDPSSSAFQDAVHIMAGRSEKGWLRKLNVYKSLGFSEEEIHVMFKKQPNSLIYSEKRIRTAVNFYFKKFNWSPSHLMMNPYALTYSLDKRVVPRCSVLQVLVSRNKVKNVKVLSLLVKTENKFLEKYVNNYKDEIPDVVDAYEGKIKFDVFNFDRT